jgi:hypothetical protein
MSAPRQDPRRHRRHDPVRPTEVLGGIFIITRSSPAAIRRDHVRPCRRAQAVREDRHGEADALDWSAAFDTTSEGDPTLAVRRGLLLAQISEALFKAVEIAPVEVVNQRRHGGKRIVEFAASDSEHRMRLAQALRVDDPHKLLRRLFEREEADFDAEWQLTETAGLGSTTRAAAGVRFTRVVQKENRRLYEFEVIDGVVPPNAQLHLRKSTTPARNRSCGDVFECWARWQRSRNSLSCWRIRAGDCAVIETAL